MRALLYTTGAVAGALAVSEVLMQPSFEERLELGLIFVAMAGVMGVAARWMPVIARRNRSLRATVTLISMLAISIVAAALMVVANRMFLSSHDLTITLVVLSFGTVSAIGLAVTVGRSLTTDIDLLSKKAAEVSAGTLDGPTRLTRNDEIGRLSRSLDVMVSRLQQAADERAADAESRRRFFSAVGHDLRTPLASMRAAIEAVRDGVVDDTDRYLASMQRDVAALSALVDDVFLLAKLDSGTYEMDLTSVDVTEVVDEAMDVLKPLARERNVWLHLKSTGRVVAVASPVPLGRAIRNLLDNAIRHAPSGTTVTVAVTNGSGDVTVRVRDEGDGFASDFVDVAFERFTRSDAARDRETGGSGLGLAIASELITALDGRIWADAGPGGTVSVELPSAV